MYILDRHVPYWLKYSRAHEVWELCLENTAETSPYPVKQPNKKKRKKTTGTRQYADRRIHSGGRSSAAWARAHLMELEQTRFSQAYVGKGSVGWFLSSRENFHPRNLSFANIGPVFFWYLHVRSWQFGRCTIEVKRCVERREAPNGWRGYVQSVCANDLAFSLSAICSGLVIGGALGIPNSAISLIIIENNEACQGKSCKKSLYFRPWPLTASVWI